MKNEKNVILAKSYDFAKQIVKLYFHLSQNNYYVQAHQ